MSTPEQSAAMPSPFPPIAEYAFLSDCHTGALVAPDGSVDWLCVPRFDAPSVFGTLLDRQAGAFRLGPFGINVPSARVYEPGTNILLTTWKTPTGWVIVRDALTVGPRRGEDRVTPHTRPPTDEDADHVLVRLALCLEGEVEIELTCEPVFDYGRVPPARRAHRRRERRGEHDQAPVRHGRRGGGRPGEGQAHAQAGRAGLLLALMG
jgi:GH15 family glucan-1,4-alpha-glucosidase